jgi:signal transduction histidine kinase
MVPNTAVVLCCLAVALWLVLPNPTARSFIVRFRAGQALAMLSAALGFATLVHELFGWNPGMDFNLYLGGHPPFPAALGALALGLGIALLEIRVREVWPSEVLAVITLQMALLGIIGHIFGVPELYGSLNFQADNGMAIQTAAVLLILAVGLLAARADRGLMAILHSHTPGGTLARRWVLLPAAVLLVMGLVYLLLQRAPAVPRALGSWTLLMTSFTFLTAAVWATAHVLHRAGLERDQAHRTLEQHVVERTAALNESNEALQAAKEDLARVNHGLERTIHERTVHLHETIRSLETVCYNIAHDLRAPNRAIAGFAEVLLARYAESLDETALDCLRRVAAAAQHSDALTLDLLAYGRLGHADLPCSKQSLAAHIEAVTEKLAHDFVATSASVEVSGPLPAVWANPTALEQVLTNLLTNALKFLPPATPPRVTIRAEPAGSCWRILIQDNGIGIPPEYQQKIFGVFQRLHSPERYPGTGIGLAIVQKSVERMGGKVGVNSSPGNGSCFWFELLNCPDTLP